VWTAQLRSRLWLQCVFAFRLVVGQTPRLPRQKTATGAVALQTVRDCDCSTPRKAERVRADFAAKSIQRTKMRRVGRCRVTAARRLATNTQRTRRSERENSCGRISHHCGPNLLFSQKRQRAGFCSTAPARIVLFALQDWNETGTRFAPCRFPLRPPRTRNDSRPQSMSKSQSQQQRIACSRSHPPNSFRWASTQMFSCESMIGAIGAEGMLSGGTTSGIGPVEAGRISGCSMRVAMSIAVKSSAPARK